MVSRFSDFLHCLTLPMLLVMFPYTATAAMRGDSTRPYVLKCAGATLAAAGAMALAYAAFGKELLSLMPNGQDYAGYALFMPVLTLAAAMTSCQVFFTNAEVSAGRFRFLAWFLPCGGGSRATGVHRAASAPTGEKSHFLKCRLVLWFATKREMPTSTHVNTSISVESELMTGIWRECLIME